MAWKLEFSHEMELILIIKFLWRPFTKSLPSNMQYTHTATATPTKYNGKHKRILNYSSHFTWSDYFNHRTKYLC